MGADGDFYDEDGSIDTPFNVNYFSLIPKGIFGAFNIFNNYISLFIFLLIIYLTLLMIRKINDSERKMKKKKKKKIMAKKVENDDEDDDENNDNDEDSEEENQKYKKLWKFVKKCKYIKKHKKDLCCKLFKFLITWFKLHL